MVYTYPPATVGEAPAPFRPTREQPCPEMRERGIYVADWLFHGNPVIYAVDSQHNVAHWAEWTEGHSYETIVRSMKRWLDMVDPTGPRLIRT